MPQFVSGHVYELSNTFRTVVNDKYIYQGFDDPFHTCYKDEDGTELTIRDRDIVDHVEYTTTPNKWVVTDPSNPLPNSQPLSNSGSNYSNRSNLYSTPPHRGRRRRSRCCRRSRSSRSSRSSKGRKTRRH